MTKQQTTEYIALILMIICLCMGLKWFTFHVDHLTRHIVAYEHQTPISDVKGSK